MTFIDGGDEEFERMLLRSASTDVPAAEASEQAWSRFAALMATVATTLGTQGVPAPPATGTMRRPTSSSPTADRRFADTIAAVKWLVAGAIGGSAVTFALVGDRLAAPAPAGLVAAAATMPSPSMALAPQAAPSAERSHEPPLLPSVAAALPASRAAATLFARGDSEVTEAPAPPKRASPAAQDEATSLAAEVAALDRARRTLDAARPDDALALLRRYLRAFPKGKLVPEAQVLRIEAFAAKGDRARVTGEAVRFLQQYPGAPQRTRVEQLRDGAVIPTP